MTQEESFHSAKHLKHNIDRWGRMNFKIFGLEAKEF